MSSVDAAIIALFVLTAAAFTVTVAWTPLLTNFLFRYRIGKQIRDAGQTPVFTGLHQAKQGTPTMGGVLVWVTTLVFAGLPWLLDRVLGFSTWHRFNFLTRAETLLPLGALVAASLVGLIDDVFNVRRIGTASGLRVRHRLVLYALIAAVGAWWFVVKLDWTTIHIPFVGNFDIGLWYVPIFIFIIVATSHSVNITDGLDGLAGGVLLAAFATFGAIAFIQGHFFLATFCGVIVGSLLAFLWFNIHPARFFMGDTGAMGLGTTLGVVAMLTNAALFLPIISFVLVLESTSVILQIAWRRLTGRKLFRSAPIHHHFEARGWPEPKVVMRFWIISAVTAVIGFILVLIDRGVT
ncbi:MAG: phospho-N-acetylmuramoyl-pentapeptide-transferase [Candidatus Kerfeldbacteria bacterium]|nr:phospho-N-acetylmuramoyl-pentapeptide-transferase [Candidatus Kerfeldbacteria bacterium]